jgi:hypothetical protein
MPNNTQLTPEDKALIKRGIGNGLRSNYAAVAREPLPDEFMALLERLEAAEAHRGQAHEDL